MEAAIPTCKRIGKLPVGLPTTQHLLGTKALPGALFGCDSTSVNVDVARKLRSAVCTALLGAHYGNSSPEIALQASASVALDPELRILDMRVSAMRRAIHKNIRRGPSTEQCVMDLLRHYHQQGEYMVHTTATREYHEAAPPLPAKIGGCGT